MLEISVIVPVYSVEKYLKSCLDSLLQQTYKNFEIILVDDASPDGCPAICDEYAAKDRRIRVIHKPENQGLGMARNTGMSVAAGKYLLFIDSDDTLQPYALQTAVDALQPDTEILVFGVRRMYENKTGKITRIEALSPVATVGTSVADSGRIFLELTQAHVFPFAWNKLYRKDFLLRRKARFETTKLIEDFLFNIDLFAKAKHILVISDCLYNYRKPPHQTLANTYAPEFYELVKRKFRLEWEFLELTGHTENQAKQVVLYAYIKHIILVFLRNHAKSAQLSVKVQKEKIRAVLQDETTVFVLNQFVPVGAVNQILYSVFRKRRINLCYFLVVAANFVKRR